MVCTLQNRTRRLERWPNDWALAEHVGNPGFHSEQHKHKWKTGPRLGKVEAEPATGARKLPAEFRQLWKAWGSGKFQEAQSLAAAHSASQGSTQPRSHKKADGHVLAPHLTTDNRNRRNLCNEKGQPWFRTKGFFNKTTNPVNHRPFSFSSPV